jgi:PPOX class probable F420-dependent enzyme
VPIDLTTELGKRAEQWLREQTLVWLVTVRADGRPQPSLVWFLWDGRDEVLVYSMPDAQKVRNIRTNSKVALHFNSSADGEEVVILWGDARLSPNDPRADQNPDYRRKYDEPGLIAAIGWTAEKLADQFSLPIRITLSNLRSF